MDNYDVYSNEIITAIGFIGTHKNFIVIPIPYKNFTIELSLGNSPSNKRIYDEIKVFDNKHQNITRQLINIKYYDQVRPYGENLYSIFKLIDEWITE